MKKTSYLLFLMRFFGVFLVFVVFSQLLFMFRNSSDQLLMPTAKVAKFFISRNDTRASILALSFLSNQKLHHVEAWYVSQGDTINRSFDSSLDTSILFSNDEQLVRSLQNELKQIDVLSLPEASFSEWGHTLYLLGDVFYQHGDIFHAKYYWKLSLLFDPTGDHYNINRSHFFNLKQRGLIRA